MHFSVGRGGGGGKGRWGQSCGALAPNGSDRAEVHRGGEEGKEAEDAVDVSRSDFRMMKFFSVADPEHFCKKIFTAYLVLG